MPGAILVVALGSAGCFTAPGSAGPSDVPSAARDSGATEAEDAAGGSAPGDASAAEDTGAVGNADGDGSAGSFVLAWQDDFDTLDSSMWTLETFTFSGNEAQFTPDNATVANGVLTIQLTANPTDTAEPYLGVEMRSIATLTYGKVSASMRFASGSGVVSGLVLFYTPYPNCNWNEIDIEHLGKSSNSSQLNSQVFLGTPDPNCTTSVSPVADAQIVQLGVNAETAFHQYDIEWTPSAVTTKIDGTVLRTWTKHIAQMNLPQNVLLTIWASSSASWAGALGPSSAPTSADVDWIKVYSWQP